ncbi:MAG: cobaltochelatase subunit CobN, partial [Gammaproteobacteria bacterium]|nr:cobaltochelatase subunit CobN [Gammaproteobacteria bacterium]
MILVKIGTLVTTSLAALCLTSLALAVPQTSPPAVGSAAPISGQENQAGETAQIGFLGLHGGVFGLLERAAGNTAVSITSLDAALAGDGKLNWSKLDVICIQHVRAESSERLEAALLDALEDNRALVVLSISGLAERRLLNLNKKGSLQSDELLKEYYSFAGEENMRRMLNHLSSKFCDGTAEVEAPLPPATGVIYHPRNSAPFASVAEFSTWAEKQAQQTETRP